MKSLLYKDLSYQLTGLCFQVHKDLGRFCRERQYADRLEELFKLNQIKYQREKDLSSLNGSSPKGNLPDFTIDDKIIVDLKAKSFITKEDYFQMQRYLNACNLELGLIINFRCYFLKPKRILNYSLYSEHSDKNSN